MMNGELILARIKKELCDRIIEAEKSESGRYSAIEDKDTLLLIAKHEAEVVLNDYARFDNMPPLPFGMTDDEIAEEEAEEE